MNPRSQPVNLQVRRINMNQDNLNNLEIKIDCDITIDDSLHDKYDYVYIVHNIVDETLKEKKIDASLENYV